jgi:hypothetical protein
VPRVNIGNFQNSNVPTPLKLPKGTLTKIDFGVYEAEIKRIWLGEMPDSLIQKLKEKGADMDKEKKYYNPGSEKARYCKLQRLLGYGNNKIGYCSMCKNLNTHILKQRVSGAVIVTRFCTEHVPDMI